MKEILLGQNLASKAFKFIKSQGMHGWTYTEHGDIGIDYYRDGETTAVRFIRGKLHAEYSNYTKKVTITPTENSELYLYLFQDCDSILDDLIKSNKPKTKSQLKQEEIQRLKQQLAELESN